MGIVDVLEVVDVEEDEGQRSLVTPGAADLPLARQNEGPSVVEPGQLIRDGLFLHLFDLPGVVQGDGDLAGEELGHLGVFLGEVPGFGVVEGDEPCRAVAEDDRDAEERVDALVQPEREEDVVRTVDRADERALPLDGHVA